MAESDDALALSAVIPHPTHSHLRSGKGLCQGGGSVFRKASQIMEKTLKHPDAKSPSSFGNSISDLQTLNPQRRNALPGDGEGASRRVWEERKLRRAEVLHRPGGPGRSRRKDPKARHITLDTAGPVPAAAESQVVELQPHKKRAAPRRPAASFDGRYPLPIRVRPPRPLARSCAGSRGAGSARWTPAWSGRCRRGW